MVSNPAQIKTVYSFVVATIMLDMNSQMGKALVQQIHPFACQNLRQGNPEFDQLYGQVERENTPHVLGTGMAATVEGFTGAFAEWLKTRGIDFKDADRKKKISIFCGDARDPKSGLAFKWGVIIYFDMDD